MDNKNFLKNKFERINIGCSGPENLQYRTIAEILSRQSEDHALPTTAEEFTRNKEGPCEFFKCNRCEKICTSKHGLVEHLKHHELEIHQCTQCARGFTSKSLLSYHMKSHAGIKHECDICNRKFNDKSNMKKHRNIHLNIKNYKCTSCPKTFSDPTNLKLHQERHAGIRFKCDFCDRSYAHRQSLKGHIKLLHLKNYLFKCDHCSESFTRTYKLTEHKNKNHFDIKYECDICLKIFHLKSTLRWHIATHPENMKCTICKEKFNVHWEYSRHINAHSGFIKCPQCPKQYSWTTLLKAHIRECHTKKFSCSVCGKSYTKKYLKKHMKFHTGVVIKRNKTLPIQQQQQQEMNNYECYYCGKKFRVKNYLAEHIASKHLKTDLFTCERCEYTSYRQRQLRSHMSNHPIMKYVCKHCTEIFHPLEVFKTHLKIHIGNSLSSINWKNHVKEFMQNNRFKCNVCCTSLATLYLLRKHMESQHLGSKHKCRHCGKEFTNTQSLKQHAEVHDGVEYQCSTCNTRFYKLSLLKHHLARNRCEYHCSTCNKRFYKLSLLKDHLARNECKNVYQ